MTMHAGRRAGRIEIEVMANGVGIAPQDQGIFEEVARTTSQPCSNPSAVEPTMSANMIVASLRSSRI